MDLEKNKVFFAKGEEYSITICPKDTLQFFGKEKRMEKFIDVINEVFLTFSAHRIDYILFTELSEPKKTTLSQSPNGPRLHLHGVIRFRYNLSIKWFLLQGYYKLTRIGIIDFDTIKDMSTWLSYCQKQQHIMMKKPISNYLKYDEIIYKLPWDATDEVNKYKKDVERLKEVETIKNDSM